MISHPFILLFYALSGFINMALGIFHKKTIEKNYFINNSHSAGSGCALIDDQSGETALKYGSKTFSHSGCGTAAVYNALLILGTPVPIADIIRHFEHYGASFFAAFGTAPQSADKYFKKLGLQTKKTADKRRFRDLAENSDIIIFTIMNNGRKIRRMLHTMCIEHNDGHFIAHNSHGRREQYASFDDMMANLGDGNNKATGIYMIGLNKSGAVGGACPKA
ncbi:MAG: hypothetical protein K5668_00465 [Lachnospiraceae bacterium]|nr:hypothetical protein [Lachnospiraceae bacterium]